MNNINILSLSELEMSDISLDGVWMPQFQRERDDAQAQRLVKEWDVLQYDPIKVIPLDDEMREEFEAPDTAEHGCWDGHGRVNAARELGMFTLPARITRVPVREAADLFRLQTRGRKTLTPYDLHRARLFSADKTIAERESAIVKVCVNHGYRFVPNKGAIDVSLSSDAGIKAVHAVQRLVDEHGMDTLDQTLAFINECWPGQNRRNDGRFLRAVAHLLVNYDRDRLGIEVIQRLAKFPPQTYLNNSGRAGGTHDFIAVYVQLRKQGGLSGRPNKRVAKRS